MPMPFLKMKSKISKDSLREKRVLGVCKKPHKDVKNSCFDPKISERMELLVTATQNCNNNEEQNIGLDSSTRDVVTNEPQDLLVEDSSKNASNMDTIFSPVLDDELYSETDRVFVEGNNVQWEMPRWGADDCSNNQFCNDSDYFLSDVLIASLPFYESGNVDFFTEISPLPHCIFPEPSVLLDAAEQYMLLPYLEDRSASSDDVKSDEDNRINRSRSKNLEAAENHTEAEQTEDFDPQIFLRNQPELADVVFNYFPDMQQPRDSPKRKAVTLVLDLDETLVHSTLEVCRDTDFSFRVTFNMQENTVYVKQRPYLYRFLERVVELFHVVIFTASHSIYASQLLDILDPDGKFVSQRFYRDSCILSDGIYTKDLTVLGLDLAKVAIVDNCPQVYRLQINNGIPIKSWYDDPTDDGLITLLPFLETLADANDVRPVIAKRFDLVID
ncbi:SCP1-like small phosphatase 4b [Arabidopsis thaliana]|uniref:SCP1-like small phosphatase 4b n=1 Tax=Arabidopsis thaliana TaxID=3702 RepID=F4JQR8_ARATH|nr:SCP1-like small phosphatase 4b [Arabidopsis thaliana]AEE84003.1 SCP1-like small phosphatase 4b [Arabidopsis thaliana]|eukprot:NP_001190760.1 SCP1-like small phosphatase 4b [Arabidopsis thaliana]